jgi:hypothetical protein
MRAIRGPIMVITVGVLFVLNNFTQFSFGETWPVLVIVAGLISLLGRGMAQPTQPPPPPFSTFQPPPPPPTAGPGGYRQTSYSQTDPRNQGGQP